jgi:hypothetical protein
MHPVPAAAAVEIVMVREDFIPAYRIRREDGGISLVFRCPHCRRVHSHGQPAGEADVAAHSRAAHCHERRSPWFGGGYRLLVIGSVAATTHLPRVSAGEIASLNEELSRS